MTYTDELVDEQIRSAVPRSDNSNWRDVRRRARRKRAPTALAGGLIVATLIAAPAVAFRSQLDDLWATAEPDKNLYVRAIAECGEGTFTLEMDPNIGGIVRQGSETLARATMTEREIRCSGRIRGEKSTPDEAVYTGTDQRSYAATKLTCETDAPLQIVVHPIWHADKRVGSVLLVAERGTRRAFASAVLRSDPDTGQNWSAVHWDSRVCSARR